MNDAEENNRAWDLILEGDARQGVAILENLVQRCEPKIGFWNNLGIGLLEAGNPVEAEVAFLQTRNVPDPGYCTRSVGVALWLQGRYTDACVDWTGELERILNTRTKQFTSEGLPLCALLWWAHATLETPYAWKAMLPKYRGTRKLKSQQLKWFMSIFDMVTADISVDMLVELAGVPGTLADGQLNPIYAERKCQAHFYAAALHPPGSEEWLMHLRLAGERTTARLIGTAEFQIAKYELSRLD